MINANDLAWLIQHLNPMLPSHGAGWLVSMKMNADHTQAEDAKILKWDIADIPEPDQDTLLKRWAASDIQTVYTAHIASQAIPQKVSAAQGGIALINANLMDAVQAVVDAADTPASVKWAWARAQDWERTSPALAYLAGKAGITDAQMDDLFVAAAKIAA